jgi:hypothetical protein
MRRLALILALCVVCCSCQKSVSRKPTFPVTGAVTVDGKPMEQIAVRCISETGIDTKDPTESFSFTDKTGKFKISTYQSGDGVPVGKYVLTFQAGKWNLFSHSYDGDEFNGKYRDPKTSTVKFEVKEGQPTDVGTIPLTTK